MTREELIKLIEQKALEAGSKRRLAIKWEMTPQELHHVLVGNRSPSRAVLDGLRYRAVTSYEPIASA